MLNPFDFCANTRCIFGPDAERKVGKILAEDGAKRVMVIHDDYPFLKESGILGRVFEDLEEAGLTYVDFGGVRPKPLRSHCKKGIELYRQEGVNYLLAIGGGSSIDTMKAIAAGVTYDGDLDDMFEREIPIDLSRKPHMADIVTIASTGSETGYAEVIYDDSKPGLEKDGAIKGTGNILRPNVCFMNPALTATVPRFQSACGIADMYGHALERYMTNIDYGIVDYMIEAVLRAIIDFGQKVIRDPEDIEARGEILWAASVAHNDTVGVGRSKDFGAHSLGGVLSAKYNVVHGAAVSTCTCAWMRHIYKDHLDRFVRFATEVWHVENDPGNPDRVIREGIARQEQWYKCIGVPTNFKEAGVPCEDYEELAKITADGGPVGRVFKLGYDDVLAIYKDCANVED